MCYLYIHFYYYFSVKFFKNEEIYSSDVLFSFVFLQSNIASLDLYFYSFFIINSINLFKIQWWKIIIKVVIRNNCILPMLIISIVGRSSFQFNRFLKQEKYRDMNDNILCLFWLICIKSLDYKSPKSIWF